MSSTNLRHPGKLLVALSMVITSAAKAQVGIDPDLACMHWSTIHNKLIQEDKIENERENNKLFSTFVTASAALSGYIIADFIVTNHQFMQVDLKSEKIRIGQKLSLDFVEIMSRVERAVKVNKSWGDLARVQRDRLLKESLKKIFRDYPYIKNASDELVTIFMRSPKPSVNEMTNIIVKKNFNEGVISRFLSKVSGSKVGRIAAPVSGGLIGGSIASLLMPSDLAPSESSKIKIPNSKLESFFKKDPENQPEYFSYNETYSLYCPKILMNPGYEGMREQVELVYKNYEKISEINHENEQEKQQK